MGNQRHCRRCTPTHRKERLHQASRHGSKPTINSHVLLLLMCFALCGAECPRACECKWKNGKESVLCVNSNLSVIPDELDAGTQVLDFTGNALVEISRDAFSDAGLTNLQKIYLARCRIKSLHRFAFRKLTNLVELDLSFNQLTAVPSHIFESISELREIKLSGNPIQRVSNDAFRKVPQLVRLELSECRIGTLEQRAFGGLEKSLTFLKMDQNQLVTIKASTLTELKSMAGLDLHGNPWNCSCSLRPLREWMLSVKIPYSVPPTCNSPARVSGKSWDKLELDDFACVPEIAANVLVTKAIEGNNVTMSCKIDGVPEPKVKWFWKNRVIANLTGSAFNRKTYVLQELGETEKASNLTILSAEIQDAGVYVCSAENKAGKVEANVTLAMSRRAPEPPVTGRVVVAGIIVAALFVVALSLVVVCACTIRRKNNMRTERRRRREDSYEKIEMNHKGGMNGRDLGVTVSAANLQNQIRKHGDYRGVSCVADPADSLARKFLPRDHWDGRSPDGANSSEAGHNADVESCAASRNMVSDSETSDPETLKSGVASSVRSGRIELPTYSHASSTLGRNFHFNSSNFAGHQLDSHSERVPSIEMKDLHIHAPPLPPDPDEGKYPPFDPRFSSDTFCTLPRRLQDRRWRRGGCSDSSQSPLLPDSRYTSSSGDSMRRFSTDNVRHQRSSSSLNLTSDMAHFTSTAAIVSGGATGLSFNKRKTLTRFPSLPTSPVDNLMENPPVYATPATTSNVVNSYDYHAAQLERFLEEYRSLQEQLSKMKTCDTLRNDNRRSLAEPLLNVNALADEVNNSRAIMSSQSTAAATSVNPSAEFNPQNHNNAPFWVPRTSLRRFSGGSEFYQS
ncbi:uncharacterized protein LOC132202386 isoform X2 [Neocloeon triangulifer]|uniref:uncharacterized protein LOC132202386 isoform X2 n=1 Tax=Neocloeon triangulifer TaxID=2078957 RepID=UPI00286F363E|nr:uncharacterized protein LOC132202386 isoform X2 [Neocloeon triangulifer]